MTDEADDFRKHIESLGADDAVQKVIEKTKDAPCPFCGSRDWFYEAGGHLVAGEDKPAPLFLLKDPRTFVGGSPNLPVIAFSCSECGFMRLHNIGVIVDGK